MKDLFDIQGKHLDEISKSNENIQAEDLISHAIYEISITTNFVITQFQESRFQNKPLDKAKLKIRLFIAMEWVTTLFYLLELDAPELEHILILADHLEPEVAVDAVLASLYAQRSLAEISIDHFCDSEQKSSPEEIDQNLAEILACLELISKRIGTTLLDLIMNR